jgi:hypothetical protein
MAGKKSKSAPPENWEHVASIIRKETGITVEEWNALSQADRKRKVEAALARLRKLADAMTAMCARPISTTKH